MSSGGRRRSSGRRWVLSGPLTHSHHAKLRTATRIVRATCIPIAKTRSWSVGRRSRASSWGGGRALSSGGRRSSSWGGRRASSRSSCRASSWSSCRASSWGGRRASSGRNGAPSWSSCRASSWSGCRASCGTRIWIRNGPSLLNIPEKASNRAKHSGDGASQILEVIWNHGHYCKVRTEFDVHHVIEISQEGGRSDAKIGGE